MNLSRRQALVTMGLGLIATPALGRSVQHDLDPYDEMLKRNRLYVGQVVTAPVQSDTKGTVRQMARVVMPEPFDEVPKDVMNEIKLNCNMYNIVFIEFVNPPSKHSGQKRFFCCAEALRKINVFV